MYCPNCGKELKVPNQRFCVHCGNDLTIISKTSQSRTDSTQYLAIPRTKPLPAPDYFPGYKQEKGVPGPHSKKCLGFALISIGIGIFAYYFGSYAMRYIFLRSMFQFSYFNYSESEIKRILFILLILVICLHIFGLTLGILSRVESRKAENLEQINSIEKAGSIFGIFGIITNSIALIVSIIMAVIIF
ncbi:MAG: zinc-ribbon domain-containing protein [Promethearchaeota archaeon]